MKLMSKAKVINKKSVNSVMNERWEFQDNIDSIMPKIQVELQDIWLHK